MAVNVVFSRISEGSAIGDFLKGSEQGLNHGNVANGKETLIEDLYISHDGLNEITDCKFYCGEFSGVYSGERTASEDFLELKDWGDTYATKGLLIDVNHDDTYEYNLKTGQMDEEANAVSLDDTSAGGTNSDDIGAYGEAHIKLKLGVPSTVSGVGIRQFDFLFKYSETG